MHDQLFRKILCTISHVQYLQLDTEAVIIFCEQLHEWMSYYIRSE